MSVLLTCALLVALFQSAPDRDAAACEVPEAHELLERFGEPPSAAAILAAGRAVLALPQFEPTVPEEEEALASQFEEALERGDLAAAARAKRHWAEAYLQLDGPEVRSRELLVGAADLELMDVLPPERRGKAAEAMRQNKRWSDALARGDQAAAEAAARAQMAALEEAGLCDTQTFGWSLIGAADGPIRRGQWIEAESLTRRALSILSVRTPGGRSTANIMRGWAQALHARGYRVEAYSAGRLAALLELELCEWPSSRAVSALSDTGNFARGVGDVRTARALAELALELSHVVHGPRSLVTAKNQVLLAGALSPMGHLTEAISLLQHAAEIQREVAGPASPDLQGTLFNLAVAFARGGQHEAANHARVEALAMAREVWGKGHPRVGQALYSVVLGAHRTGVQGDFLPMLHEAIEIFDAAGMGQMAARSRLLASELLGVGGRLDALVALDEQLAREGASPVIRSEVLVKLSVAHFNAGEYEESLWFAEAALDELDQFAGAAEEARLSARARLGESLLGLGRYEEAAANLEVVLVEQESRFEHGPDELASGARVSDALELREVGGATALALANSGQGARAALVAERVIERPLAELLGEGASSAPGSEPFAPMGAAELRAGLRSGELLITSLWSESCVLTLWAHAGPSGGFRLARAVLGRAAVAELRTVVEELSGALRAGVDASAAGQALGEQLFDRELLAALHGDGRALWVPSGPLNELPLEILLGEAGFGVATARAPSGSVLTRARQRAHASSGPTTAMLVGDPLRVRGPATQGASRHVDQLFPALPGSRDEVRAIAAAFRAAQGEARVLLGADAGVSRLTSALDTDPPRYLHLAAHGRLGTEASPHDAAIVLATTGADDSSGGVLTLETLLRDWSGKLERTDLAVLSACDTQAGMTVGDSWMALSWGFLAAGAPSVIATLWKVDDRATGLLMQRLYGNLLGTATEPRVLGGRRWVAGEAMPKAEALAEAKAWLREATLAELASREESLAGAAGLRGGSSAPVEVDREALRPYAAPRYWAAFVLIGSPD